MNSSLVSAGIATNSTLLANSSPSGFSVLNWLPKNSFTNFLIILNHHLSDAIAKVLPNKWFFHPLIYDPLATLFVMLVIALVFTFFVDFLLHAWKIPFAIFVDFLDILGLTMPIFNVFAAFGSLIIFSLLARNTSKFWRTGFILVGISKAFLPQFSLIPLNTIMMLIVAVL